MKVCCCDCRKTGVKLVERPKNIKSGMKNTVDVCINCRNKWYKKHDLLLPRYNFTCPNCMYEQSAAPSIFMSMGHNSGCGSCSNCDVFLHLEIKEAMHGTEMNAILWDEYLDKKDEMKT
jgi:transcription elongation factor Elf1